MQAIAISFALHVGLLVVLFSHPKVRFIAPNLLAKGNNGQSTTIFYSASGIDYSRPNESISERPRPSRPPKRASPVLRPKVEVETADALRPNSADSDQRAGSLLGSVLSGALTGHDARPAIPVVYPDPDRSGVPNGVRGTVIVEVTIDEHGDVTDAKVLQALGYGMEERVLATLKNWHFLPATLDGQIVPSRQDVHFHFPS